MSHTVTSKLNQAAREHQGQSGTTFFIGLGEKNYDFKAKANVYTNYDAAVFAKDGQVDFYRSALVEGAIVTVTGSGVIVDDSNKEYKPKLVIQDAKIEFIHSPQGQASQQQSHQQQAPQQPGGFQQQAPQQQGGFVPQQQVAGQPVNTGGFQQQAPINNNEPPF